MASQKKLDVAYMKMAKAIAELSLATRLKVGAILVSPKGGVIGEGFNGTPGGFDNNPEICEPHVCQLNTRSNFWECTYCHLSESQLIVGSCPERTVTKPECIHAECNVLMKVAKSTNSTEGSTLYCTASPCIECSKMLIQAGVVRVVYGETYRNSSGIELLMKAKIQVEKLS